MRIWMFLIVSSLCLVAQECDAVGFDEGNSGKVEAPRMRRRRAAAESSAMTTRNEVRKQKTDLSVNVYSENDKIQPQPTSSGERQERQLPVVEVIKVKGKGVGETKEDALKDAYRDAVERAVGMFVDAEQLVKNDQLVKDQVLTHSNAYIEKYKTIDSVTKGGAICIEILATVRRGDLTRRLRSLMPIQSLNLSEINQDLHAQIVTEGKRDRDALSLIRAEFSGFEPVAQLLRVSLASPQPTITHTAGRVVKLEYKVKIIVDTDRYFQQWVPRMEKILSQISLKSPKVVTLERERKCANWWRDEVSQWHRRQKRSEYLSYDNIYFMHAHLYGQKRFVIGEGNCGSSEGGIPSDYCDWNREGIQINRCAVESCSMAAKPRMVIGLVNRMNQASLSLSLYSIDPQTDAFLQEWLLRYSGVRYSHEADNAGRITVFHFSFKDADGNEVVGKDLPLKNVNLTNIGAFRVMDNMRFLDAQDEPDTKIPYIFYITPLVAGFARECSTYFEVEVAEDDVAKIKSVAIRPEKSMPIKGEDDFSD